VDDSPAPFVLNDAVIEQQLIPTPYVATKAVDEPKKLLQVKQRRTYIIDTTSTE
jgi:hypothetical protein